MASCMMLEAQSPEIRRMVRTAFGLFDNVIDIIPITATLSAPPSITLEDELPK